MSDSGERLARAMEERGVSVAQLSEMAGLHTSTIYRMLNEGAAKGYVASWQVVATCLGVPLSELLK